MSGTSHLALSGVLADAARAVVSTQRDMDRLASQSRDGLPLAPLAFIVKRTEVTLLGTLSMRRDAGQPARDPALSFALLDRVQAGLRGGEIASLSSRVSVAIEAVEPPHAS
jgi:hypothetical protein